MTDLSKTLDFKQRPRAIRDGFGAGLLELGQDNSDVIALTGDVCESVRIEQFALHYPERFIEVGVAEQNLAGISAGLALSGKIPFIGAYAAFSPGRNWDQIRVSICYNKANVKIVGSHAGLSVGEDGATHQALEDIALTRCLPNLVVVSPMDAEEARKATHAIAKHDGPCYLRLARNQIDNLTTLDTPFHLGRANVLVDGSDATIFATGQMVGLALKIADKLKPKHKVAVVNIHTIKPLDHTTILAYAKKTGALVSAEEHQIIGGLGSAIAEVLAENHPTPLVRVGIRDKFGQSGTAQELFSSYNLDEDGIEEAVLKAIKLKCK